MAGTTLDMVAFSDVSSTSMVAVSTGGPASMAAFTESVLTHKPRCC